MPSSDWADELRVAADAAREAGAAALAFYGRDVATRMKAGDSPVTAADHAANDVILRRLRDAFPDDAILSEETPDSSRRLAGDRVWIVDPLDGTKEFLAGNGEFAIMIGLALRGRPVVGAVYLPARGALFTAAAGSGTWVERDGGRTRLHCAPVRPGAIRLVGSRSHASPLLDDVRRELDISDVRPSGSVGVKCALIVEGSRDLYVHPAGIHEWDTCAPEILVLEAGGFVSDCLGETLRYNRPVPAQPDGIIAAGDLPDRDLVDRVAAIYRDRTPVA